MLECKVHEKRIYICLLLTVVISPIPNMLLDEQILAITYMLRKQEKKQCLGKSEGTTEEKKRQTEVKH